MAAKKEVKTKAPEVKVEETKAPEVLKFSKVQFVKSKKFAKHKDLLNALLDDKKTYSIKEVEETVHNFLYSNKK